MISHSKLPYRSIQYRGVWFILYMCSRNAVDMRIVIPQLHVPAQATVLLARVCVSVSPELLFFSDLASVTSQYHPNCLFRLQRAPKHLAPPNCSAVLLHRSVRPLSFHAVAESFGALKTHHLASYVSLRARKSLRSFSSPKAIVTIFAMIPIVVATVSRQDPLHNPSPCSMDCSLSLDAFLSRALNPGMLCWSVFALSYRHGRGLCFCLQRSRYTARRRCTTHLAYSTLLYDLDDGNYRW